MSKFRKKPVVIEAVQFDGTSANDPCGVFRRDEDASPYVVTIHGQPCYIKSGDWIIPEPDGVHYYPCKPDIFEATYEPVSSVGIRDDHDREQPRDRLQAAIAACQKLNDDELCKFALLAEQISKAIETMHLPGPQAVRVLRDLLAQQSGRPLANDNSTRAP